MTDSNLARLDLEVKKDYLSAFIPLLSWGVALEADLGGSLQDFICNQLGISESYLDTRIQTVFLNGKAVDDPAESMITDRSIIALSASMPGLVGATLRKGGALSPMRSQVSYRNTDGEAFGGRGQVVLKLFNLVGREVGPHLLERGFELSGRMLQDFFNLQAGRFAAGCIGARIDGQMASTVELPHMAWEGRRVFLRVRVAGR